MNKKKVILVTDGDKTAKEVIEKVSDQLDLRVISKSGGNPTPYSGQQLLEMIAECPTDPVVVMFDDNGSRDCGSGEKALEVVGSSSEVKVLGVLAVASDTEDVVGIDPDFSITNQGEIVTGPVDKEGTAEAKNHKILEGDTVDVINGFDKSIVVGVIGIGDIGKMKGKDAQGSITYKALEEILKRSGR
ncbi:hypothetical protein Halha_0595 [Halobacteroides halobius DSM 5150]|uniref:Stage V sporulation protein AE n=1 Tax=Halobacteroides halobius (strain ATCC 35273 / DSM 5150 / MD-1) TaxID=748449 RepID=L0K879_HALHC|nr:stage V sporulation protein AE [Halobacteroides halobius]AGB40569.1 hypothetical protein Halha_0595 [Halobacteroides halobius DSM 5150]